MLLHPRISPQMWQSGIWRMCLWITLLFHQMAYILRSRTLQVSKLH